jgi:hypothetical protein
MLEEPRPVENLVRPWKNVFGVRRGGRMGRGTTQRPSCLTIVQAISRMNQRSRAEGI